MKFVGSGQRDVAAVSQWRHNETRAASEIFVSEDESSAALTDVTLVRLRVPVILQLPANKIRHTIIAKSAVSDF